MSFIILAEDDEQAKMAAFEIADKRDKDYDDGAIILSVHKRPFGALKETEIYNYLKKS